jgi:hypothetical protein
MKEAQITTKRNRMPIITLKIIIEVLNKSIFICFKEKRNLKEENYALPFHIFARLFILSEIKN